MTAFRTKRMISASQAVSILLLALTGLARSGRLEVVPGPALAGFVLIALLVVPGLALGQRFSRTTDGVRGLAEAGALGLGWWAILGVGYFYAPIPFEVFAWIGLLACVFLTFLPRRTAQATAGITDPWFVAVLAVITIAFAAVSAQASRFHIVYFDTYFHLAGVGRLLEGGTYHAQDPFLGGAAPAQTPYAANTWYLLLALTSWFARVPPEITYVAASAIVAVASILVVYVLARAILGDRPRAVLSAAIYVAYITVVYTWIIVPVLPVMYMAFGPYPGEVLRFLPYTLLLLLLIEAVSSDDAGINGASAALITAALVTIHGQYLLYLAVSLFALFVAALFARQRIARLKRYARIAVPISAAVVVFLVLRAGLGSRIADRWFVLPYDTNPFVVQHDYLVLTPNLYMLNPTALIAPSGVILVAGIIGGIAMLAGTWAGVDRRRLAYALALLVVPVAIVWNPIVIPVLVRLVTWVLPRRIDFFSNLLVFAGVAFAFLVAALMTLVRRALPAADGRAMTLLVILAATGLALASSTFREPIATALVPRPGAIDITAERHDELISYFNALPDPVVVCADTNTSYLLGAFTKHHVVSVDETRMGVSDAEAAQRVADNQALLSGTLSAFAFRNLADRYGVQYLVLSHDSPARASILALGSVAVAFETHDSVVLKWTAPRE
jgi:hypothetical protein